MDGSGGHQVIYAEDDGQASLSWSTKLQTNSLRQATHTEETNANSTTVDGGYASNNVVVDIGKIGQEAQQCDGKYKLGDAQDEEDRVRHWHNVRVSRVRRHLAFKTCQGLRW